MCEKNPAFSRMSRLFLWRKKPGFLISHLKDMFSDDGSQFPALRCCDQPELSA